MTYSHEFVDYLSAEHHTCLPKMNMVIGKEAEEIFTGNEATLLQQSLLHTFESQLGAFLRGFLIGHDKHGLPSEILDAVIDNVCPICLSFWIEAHDECCLGHALEHFMETAYAGVMVAVDLGPAAGASSHGDPSLN